MVWFCFILTIDCTECLWHHHKLYQYNDYIYDILISLQWWKQTMAARTMQCDYLNKDYFEMNDDACPIMEYNTLDSEAWMSGWTLRYLICHSTGLQSCQEFCIPLSPSHSSFRTCKLLLISLAHPGPCTICETHDSEFQINIMKLVQGRKAQCPKVKGFLIA